jgi:hypothetical protein
MFDSSLSNLNQKDKDKVEQKIKNWQKLYTERVKNHTKYEAKLKLKEEKEQEKQKKKKKKTPTKKKRRRASGEHEIEDEDQPAAKKTKVEESSINDIVLNDEPDIFYMGMPQDIWGSIFSYLSLRDVSNVAVTCKDLNFYTNLNYIWLLLGTERLSPKFAEMKQVTFPALTFKGAYCEAMNSVCLNCGTHCPNKEVSYFYLVDGLVCTDCQKLTKFALINKSDAKKNFKLSDTDLRGMRSLRLSNPFHRSTPMFRFLQCELEYRYDYSQEKSIRTQFKVLLKKIKQFDEVDHEELINNWINEEKRTQKGHLHEYIKDKKGTARNAVTLFLTEAGHM